MKCYFRCGVRTRLFHDRLVGAKIIRVPIGTQADEHSLLDVQRAIDASLFSKTNNIDSFCHEPLLHHCELYVIPGVCTSFVQTCLA